MRHPLTSIIVDISDIVDIQTCRICVELKDSKRHVWLPLYYKDGTDIMDYVPGGIVMPQWLYEKTMKPKCRQY